MQRPRCLAICDPESSDEENDCEVDLDNSNSHVKEKSADTFNTTVEEKKKVRKLFKNDLHSYFFILTNMLYYIH